MEAHDCLDGFALLEALMVEAYAGMASPEQVIGAIDEAGDKLSESIPDPAKWGTAPSSAAAAKKAEDMFAAG